MGILPHPQHGRVLESQFRAGLCPGIHLVTFGQLAVFLRLFFLGSFNLGNVVFYGTERTSLQRLLIRAPNRTHPNQKRGPDQPSKKGLFHFFAAFWGLAPGTVLCAFINPLGVETSS